MPRERLRRHLRDARRMLAGTSAVYTAKIRRGGMGTGMPYRESILTEEELAALADRFWTFSIEIAWRFFLDRNETLV